MKTLQRTASPWNLADNSNIDGARSQTRTGRRSIWSSLVALVALALFVGLPTTESMGAGPGGSPDRGGAGDGAQGDTGGAGTPNAPGGNAGAGLGDNLADLPLEELSAEEEEDLLFMREEEKLARDVYLTMFDLWAAPIFENIAGSEQRHADAMGNLLVRYSLDDPFIDEIGSFTNPDLQSLYQSLIESGEESLVAALTVGATIEDLDINDLANVALPRTDNQDITMVYENLLAGSENHMRAFVKQLAANDATYEPQFISIEMFEAILSETNERGANGSDGDPTGDGPNAGAGNGDGGEPQGEQDCSAFVDEDGDGVCDLCNGDGAGHEDAGQGRFVRGDANQDGRRGLSDAVAMLRGLFQAGKLGCEDAADVNDDGQVDIADPVRLLLCLFDNRDGWEVPVPNRGAGGDPTPDRLGCE